MTHETPRGDRIQLALRKNPPSGLTFVELGNIMLKEVPEQDLLDGYGTLDPEWVGRYALLYNDINPDGTLN